VREQLTREPLGLCHLLLNPEVKQVLDFKREDIKIAPGSYRSHPQISYGDIAV
jgi:thymidylate synthase